jgi:hypothetical protein
VTCGSSCGTRSTAHGLGHLANGLSAESAGTKGVPTSCFLSAQTANASPTLFDESSPSIRGKSPACGERKAVITRDDVPVRVTVSEVPVRVTSLGYMRTASARLVGTACYVIPGRFSLTELPQVIPCRKYEYSRSRSRRIKKIYAAREHGSPSRSFRSLCGDGRRPPHARRAGAQCLTIFSTLPPAVNAVTD